MGETSRDILVEKGGLEVVTDRTAVLRTLHVGSGCALVCYDPTVPVAGLAHILLPRPAPKAPVMPFPAVYAESAVTELLMRLEGLGASRDRLLVKLTGCGGLRTPVGPFTIGERVELIVRKMLWAAGLRVHAAELGGPRSRSVRVAVASGAVTITSLREEHPL